MREDRHEPRPRQPPAHSAAPGQRLASVCLPPDHGARRDRGRIGDASTAGSGTTPGSRNGVEAAVVDVVTVMTGLPGIALATRLAGLGLKRLHLAQLACWIESEFRVEAEPALLASFATIADVVDFIAARIAAEPDVV